MREFKNPIERDAAWGRYFAKHGLKLTKACHAPTNGERLAQFRARHALNAYLANAYPWPWTRAERYALEQMQTADLADYNYEH